MQRAANRRGDAERRSVLRKARPVAITLRAVIRLEAARLRRAKVAFGHGTTNAGDEAAWLTVHALGIRFEDLEHRLDRPVSVAQQRRIEALVDKRIVTRKPAAYLTHEAWLGEHRFYVDERVIVPRSFIAELLRDDFRPWVKKPQGIRSALDLCTGSGCLAILLAKSFPGARIDAADISRDALEVARRNVADYRLARRVKLVRSDLFRSLKGRRYDLIVSNPPYVTASAMRRLPAEYRNEPALALAGGTDGLDLVRNIIEEAPAHLAPGGLLVVEVGHARTRVEKAFPRLPFVWPETSGGDDCVFLITRESLVRALSIAERSARATTKDASPRGPAARSPARA